MFARSVTVTILAEVLFNSVVSPSPFEKRQNDGIESDDFDNDVDDSDDGFFVIQEDNYPSLNERRGKVSVDTNKSVFYSRVGPHEDKLQKFADQISGKLLRKAYSKGFTDKIDAYTGYAKFLQKASQAFAEKTSETAHVLLPTDGSTDISKKVWSKFEKSYLIADGGRCNRIIKVDPVDFNKQCVLWDHNGISDLKLANCKEENGLISASKDPPSSGLAAPSSLEYTPDWCGVHVTQYQIHEPDTNPIGTYKLSIHIFDAAQKEIGGVDKADAPSEQSVDVDSALPLMLIVTVQNVNDDAVLFAYERQSWESNDQKHHCNFGAYDNDKRKGDCEFSY